MDASAPLRILHLEDSAADAELVAAALADGGFVSQVTRVETQADFAAALERRFDVILADYTLPAFDGLSALKLAQERCPHVPFIFVSGTLGEEVAIEALKIGAADYLLKERLSRIVPSMHRALREARLDDERRRTAKLLAGERRLLEMIARGAKLTAILDALCCLVEALSPGSLASILLLDPDGQRLWHGAAPSLAQSYIDAIDGAPIGPIAGSCGTAAYRNEPVIVEDIAEDPRWAPYRALALPHGLRACWSTPVRASDGDVLATFAIYERQPARPTAQQLSLIEQVTALASIAIERKRAEEARQAHLWFLESMDRVNRAVQSTNDLEQMLRSALDAVLAIFDCDRAWLVYPGDPDAPTWGVTMEHTRPEFPGALALKLELPVDAEIAAAFRLLRASQGAVRFGPGGNHPLPAEAAARFGIQSMLAMAVHPKGDRPYVLGLHQCSYARAWAPREERLLQEIGRRLEDALTSVLSVRSLGESERRLEEGQRISHVGYWERDLVSNAYTWSDETYRIFGLTPQERHMSFTDVQAFLHPADRDARVQAVADALAGGARYDLEYRVVRPTGEVRHVRSVGDVVRDDSGQPRRVFGTIQDITERKRAERRIITQSTVTAVLAEAATVQDATPKILRAVCEGLGWDVGALWRTDREAGVLRCVEVWHAEGLDVSHFEAASRRTTFPPGVGLPGRVWLKRQPAYIRDIVADAKFLRAPIAAAEGLHAGFGTPILLGREVLGVMEFFSREIREPDQELLDTMAVIGSQLGQFIERKQAEDALRRAQDDLAHVARVATLGEVSASIAHEINQPLAALVNNAAACLHWLEAHNLEEAKHSAEFIIADGHRAGEIVSRIRALAKKVPVKKDWLDVNAAILEVLALVRGQVHGNGVAVSTRLAPDLPLVEGDRVQVQQVLLNLVMNAIEAMSGIDGARDLVIASAVETPRAVIVSVHDSGLGLTPAGGNRLFQAFYTTKPHGMGMGLAISRSIVEAHGGRLWATANAPRGAVFHFTLPIDGDTPR